MRHRSTSYSSAETRPADTRATRNLGSSRHAFPTSSSAAQVLHEVNHQLNDTLTEAAGDARDPNAEWFDGKIS
ncbi:hypothetical protein LRS06_17435 [Hymenobacter sp. J193]|uniref:hypothetical protein n=1 Tax=Hymenobacter sp. J193 TaxID=2898429 RepID=UPI002150DD1A|nr:hypothetical protein [Hymenobacter sp. J193]MCR5889520.1 hypothetical protein [Hymenobacter sp. J193]